jgi:hypothetical protein
MIDTKNKIIFIHIPRTGGSEFSNHYYNDILSSHLPVEIYSKYCSYGDFDAKHFRYKDYKHFIGPKIKEYKLVTVVRNTYDLAVSNWRMHLRNYNDYNERHKNFVKDFPSFVSWLELQKDKSEQGKNHTWLTPYESMRQKTYLNGAPDCEIIRYESYNDGVHKFFLNNFGIETKLKKYTNDELSKRESYKNRKINYPAYYDQSLERRIRNLYRKEIEYFDYKIE